MDSGSRISELPPMGFIAVQCNFHRPPGDPKNEQTWPFPLIHETAEGSKESQLVVSEKYDHDFIDAFVEAGEKLAARGAVGLMTSCGFLANAQPELAARLPIPIATSSLIQIPALLAFLPPQASLGIITYNADKLNSGHLEQLGVPTVAFGRIHIVGAEPGGHLQNLVREKGPYVHADFEAELIHAARMLVKAVPATKAIVLECTQMPPFAEAIQTALGGRVLVHDVYTMGRWFYSGLTRRKPVEWDSSQ